MPRRLARIEPAVADYTRDPVGFIRAAIVKTERGRPFVLPPHHVRALTSAFVWVTVADCERCTATEEPVCIGHLQFRLLAWSEPKKSGKSLMCGILILWWALTRPGVEILLVANDLEQVQGRVYQAVRGLLKYNRHLDPDAKVLEQVIRLSNGSTIVAMAADWKGAAGGNHAMACIDEPAGVTQERAVRLLEELTPVPTEVDAWLLMAGVAGWVGESEHWEAIYKKGRAGRVLDAELPVYQADELVMYWSVTARMPTQTARYLEEQQRLLRPTTFNRLWRNAWEAAESVFLTPALWDPCVDPEHVPMVADKRVNLFVGVDVGIKHDTSAVIAITRHEDRLYLARHTIWTPTPETPIDLEATIEQEIYRLAHEFHLVTVLCDPYAMHRSMASLKRSGLNIREYAQTPAHLTAMGQALLDALKAKALVLYADSALRQQALNTTAVESVRGFRIAKERASKKIDAVIALSLAIVGATEGDIPYVLSEAEEREQQYQEAKLWRLLGFESEPVPYGGLSNIVQDTELYRAPDSDGWGLGDLGYSDGALGPYNK